MVKPSKIFTLGEKNPRLVFFYLLILGIGQSLFQMFISGSNTLIPLGLNLNFFNLSLIFFLMIVVYKTFIPTLRIKQIISEITIFYWLVIFLPLVRNFSFGPFLLPVGFALLVGGSILKKRSNMYGEKLSEVIYPSLGSVLLLLSSLLLVEFQTEFFSGISSPLRLVVLSLENIILVSLLLFITDRGVLRAFMKSVKPFRTLHFFGIVLIGAVVGSALSEAPFLTANNILLWIPISCMVLTWQFSTMINDYHDIQTDRIVHPDRPLVKGKIDKTLYKRVGLTCALLSLLLSISLSLELFILDLIFVIAGISYSVPSIRLKDRAYGHICVGYASTVAFLFGVYGIYSLKDVDLLLNYSGGFVPFFPDILSFSVIILVVFSVSPLINAVGDYEGDKKTGVQNVYTVYGLKKGKKIVSVLIILLFWTPLLVFHSMVDFLLVLPTSLLAAYLFYRYERYRVVFGLYFIIISYIILKLLF